MSPRQVPPGLADKLTSAAGGFAVAFDDIRMEDIASASGIPRATLYYYFAGTDDVLAFLLRSMLDEETKQGGASEGAARSKSPRQGPPGLADKLTSAAGGVAVAFDDIRMEDIASASGIPRATLYYYFAGKDDVLAFLLRSMLDDLQVSVDTALEVRGDTRARLRAVMRAQFGHLAANPAAAQLLIMNLCRAGRVGTIASGIDEGIGSAHV